MGLLGNEDSDDDITPLVENAKSDTVTRDLLTEAKGGIVTHNLGHKPIVDCLATDEQPHFILLNTSKGVRLRYSDDEQALKPSGSRRAFAVLTDHRLLFLVGGKEAVKRRSFQYDDIVSFETRSGRTKHRLLVCTETVLADFPINLTNLGDDELDRVQSFLDERTDDASANWTDESTEVSNLVQRDVPESTDDDSDELNGSDDSEETAETAIEDEPPSDEGEDETLIAMAKSDNKKVVEVYPDHVAITREGGLLSSESEREVPYDALNSVEFFEAKGRIRRGYLYLNIAGGDSPDSAAEKLHSQDSVSFGKKERNDAFREVTDAIQEKLRSQQSSEDSPESATDSAIETLREKYAAGEISKEEYEERLAVLEDT